MTSRIGMDGGQRIYRCFAWGSSNRQFHCDAHGHPLEDETGKPFPRDVITGLVIHPATAPRRPAELRIPFADPYATARVPFER